MVWAALVGLGLVAIGLWGIGRVLARLGLPDPLAFHAAAAWRALWSGPPPAPTTTASPPRHGAPDLGPPPFAAGHPAHGAGVAWLPHLGWGLGALALAWQAWGAALWAYNVPAELRTVRAWLDWALARWPVVTAGWLLRRPAWGEEAWRRHRALLERAAARGTPHEGLWRRAAAVLDAGFAASEPDIVWGEPGPGGVRRRRIIIAAAPDGIRPEWPMGFHAATMEAWRQWAERWAAVALHHGGIPGEWAVDAHGVVRPARPAPAATSATAPQSPVESQGARAPSPQTRWGAHGLRWAQVERAAPNPLPPLAAPLPPDRVQDVIAALAMLGIPDVRGVGGVRGLAVDTTWIRPQPVQAQRVLRLGEALAGQLGHGSQPLRIAYVQGKPGVLAVERPRPDRQFVGLLAAVAQTPGRVRQQLAQWALPVCCGVTPDGVVVWQDAAGWPHLLAGGTTGGGKTTALAAWLGSLCLTTPPGDVEIVIVDPKAGSQFPWAAGMPHVRRVLTDPAEVAALVGAWAAEADQRYAAFARLGVPDLRTARSQGAVDWPYRLLVIDEYKDLKDQLDADTVKDLERDIGRLGQKARGAGIHVWLATQHPLAETLSSPLKANLPARLALTVASATASRVILDDVGAEALTGKGDALFWHAEAQRVPIRIQTPWVDDATWAAIQAGWGGEAAPREVGA